MVRRVTLGILAIGLCAILTPVVPAAGQTPTQKSSETTDKIKGYSVEKKNEAVAYGKKLVSGLDVKLKELEAQVARDTGAAKADGERQLKELKALRANAGKKLDELGRATAESWDRVKHGFAEAYDKAAAGFRK